MSEAKMDLSGIANFDKNNLKAQTTQEKDAGKIGYTQEKMFDQVTKFDKACLSNVETKVENSLPSKEVIDEEKAAK